MSIDIRNTLFFNISIFISSSTKTVYHIHYQQHLSSVGRISHVQQLEQCIVRCLVV